MGCFNVSCSISKISIGSNDPVIFIPLKIKDYYSPKTAEDILNQNRSFINVNEYYDLFSLPIEGLYNHYGSITAIVPSPNTKAIEEFTGVSIQKFIDFMFNDADANFKNEEIKELVRSLSGMFIHKEIYEELCKGSQLIDSDNASPEILEKLGFNYIKECDKEGSRNEYQIWGHPDNEKLLVLSSSRFYSSFCNDDGVRNNDLWFNSMQAFSKKLIEHFGVTVNLQLLENDSQYNKQFKDLQDIQELLSKKTNEGLNSKSSFNKPLTLAAHNFWGLKDMPYLSEIYSNSVADGSIQKEWIDWNATYISMYSMNCFLFPNLMGEQDGNDKATKRLLKKSLEIIDKRLKNSAEEED